jgi:uncharacterized protein YwgA
VADNRHHVEERLAELVSDYVDGLNAGTAPTIDRYLDQHAELADELRPLLRTAANVAVEARSIQLPHPEAAFNTVRGRLLAGVEREALRASVETGRGSVKIDRRSDVLLLLLHAAQKVWGTTKLQKLLFLVGKETKATTAVPDYFQHVAYNFGPFDQAVYQDVEALKKLGFIEARPPAGPGRGVRRVDAVYQLTPRGKKYADALARGEEGSTSGLAGEVEEIVRQYGQLSHDDLLKYVYRTYPETTTESTIRDQVLGRSDDEDDDR